MTKVLKPFNTRLQRFAAGDDVPDDADLSPHTVVTLTDLGFLEGSAQQTRQPFKARAAEAVPTSDEQPAASE